MSVEVGDGQAAESLRRAIELFAVNSERNHRARCPVTIHGRRSPHVPKKQIFLLYILKKGIINTKKQIATPFFYFFLKEGIGLFVSNI